MTIFHLRRSRPIGVVVIIFIIFLGIYLNRSYSHIYSEIKGINLQFSDQQGIYMINGSTDNNFVKSPIVYVALGDSLTAGVGLNKYEDSYPYLLAQRFGKSYRAVTLKDRAIPGTRTENLLNKLLPAAIKDNPDIVTVLIGINDIHGLISADNFKNNYDRILSRLTKETSAKIYVINLPFIGADTLVLPPYNYLLDARTKEFNQIIKQLANKYSVSYIDLYAPTVSMFKKSGDQYSADSFHPSATSYKIWADIIYDNINK